MAATAIPTTTSSTTTPGAAGTTTPPTSARLENTTAYLPIITGSVAFYLGKKADEYQTHEWTLYLRSPGNEDLSLVISKVIFSLHASFAQPIRELTEPPYEVTERGWGEFEAQIRIVWKDPSEQPILLSQLIKLYPPGGSSGGGVSASDTGQPVVAETYDEVVFTNPTEHFFRQLQSLSEPAAVAAGGSSIRYTPSIHFGTFSDSLDVKALIGAQKFLSDQLGEVKEHLVQLDEELEQVDKALQELQEKRAKRGSGAVPAGEETTEGGGTDPARSTKPSMSRPTSSQTSGPTGNNSKKAKVAVGK